VVRRNYWHYRPARAVVNNIFFRPKEVPPVGEAGGTIKDSTQLTSGVKSSGNELRLLFGSHGQATPS
jgi:hypothetical protein